MYIKARGTIRWDEAFLSLTHHGFDENDDPSDIWSSRVSQRGPGAMIIMITMMMTVSMRDAIRYQHLGIALSHKTSPMHNTTLLDKRPSDVGGDCNTNPSSCRQRRQESLPAKERSRLHG